MTNRFDTTRANIEYVGAQAVDLLTPEGQDIYSERRFKGNMDIGLRPPFLRPAAAFSHHPGERSGDHDIRAPGFNLGR
jgi:hypothetical protein